MRYAKHKYKIEARDAAFNIEEILKFACEGYVSHQTAVSIRTRCDYFISFLLSWICNGRWTTFFLVGSLASRCISLPSSSSNISNTYFSIVEMLSATEANSIALVNCCNKPDCTNLTKLQQTVFEVCCPSAAEMYSCCCLAHNLVFVQVAAWVLSLLDSKALLNLLLVIIFFRICDICAR